MDFNLLLEAFGTVMLNPMNFFFVFIGITAGIMVGALPGLTATALDDLRPRMGEISFWFIFGMCL